MRYRCPHERDSVGSFIGFFDVMGLVVEEKREYIFEFGNGWVLLKYKVSCVMNDMKPGIMKTGSRILTWILSFIH